MNQRQMNIAPFKGIVKILVIANVAIWIGGVLILQNMILKNTALYDIFALVPAKVITEFWVWQIFTYMFLHSTSIFHILFNMLTLWMFGAELEERWGSKFFLTYYLVCGIGAGVIYLLGTLIYYLITGQVIAMADHMVGASGATYGILLAYGLLFGERVLLFMMLFPMKAKYFVGILGLVELVTLMDSGLGSKTANLAHLGGIAVGFVFLAVVARMRAQKSGNAKRGRRLKLVVNNERKSPTDNDDGASGPKYWN